MTDHENDTTDRLARIETTLTALNTHLMGNGQPGILTKYDTRLNDLENTRSRMRGALAVITVALTATGGFLMKHLFKS